MTEQLEGKVSLVTGAATGIGRASALTFAREGAKVVVADVDAEVGEETVQMIKKAGGEGIFVKADVWIITRLGYHVWAGFYLYRFKEVAHAYSLD